MKSDLQYTKSDCAEQEEWLYRTWRVTCSAWRVTVQNMKSDLQNMKRLRSAWRVTVQNIKNIKSDGAVH